MPKVCFAPIWYPLEQYATSRLRAKSAVELLRDDLRWEVELDYSDDADIAVIVQLCSDRNLEEICRNRDQMVVYDICDRYFSSDAIFRTDEGVLHARDRCLEVIERADVLIVPTRQLKVELNKLFPAKPCLYLPELVDYGALPSPARPAASRRLVWFGHPTRGNFESARWMIDHLSSVHGYQPVLVTTPATIRHRYPAYADSCTAWSIDAIRLELAAAALCVVAHSPAEPFKSANRFTTAMIQGVPTLTSGSPACDDILEAAGHPLFSVCTTSDVDRALECLADSGRRRDYVADVQREIWLRHAPEVVRRAYVELFEWVLPDRDNY
ncbi:MAG: hypothetical protein HQ465_02440 [Rhodospirillales bacterium]|nr:hypothetical protein [Rhodospirillales bacterium]